MKDFNSYNDEDNEFDHPQIALLSSDGLSPHELNNMPSCFEKDFTTNDFLATGNDMENIDDLVTDDCFLNAFTTSDILADRTTSLPPIAEEPPGFEGPSTIASFQSCIRRSRKRQQGQDRLHRRVFPAVELLCSVLPRRP